MPVTEQTKYLTKLVEVSRDEGTPVLDASGEPEPEPTESASSIASPAGSQNSSLTLVPSSAVTSLTSATRIATPRADTPSCGSDGEQPTDIAAEQSAEHRAEQPFVLQGTWCPILGVHQL